MKYFSVVFIILCFVSCVTTNFYVGRTDVYGIVYDNDKNCVPNYQLSITNIDGSETFYSVSDINGKFVFNNVCAGVYKIKGNGKNYESYSDEIMISDKKQIIIISTYSDKNLIKKIEELLNEYDYDGAEKYLNRLKQIDTKNVLLQNMFEIIILYKKNDIKEVIKILKRNLKNNSGLDCLQQFLTKLEDNNEK